MVEGISELPTVLTSFDTLAEAQELLDESGPFAQLFVWPPFYVISVLGIIVGTNSAWNDAMRVRARLTGRFLRRHAGRDEVPARLARRSTYHKNFSPLEYRRRRVPAAPRRAPLDSDIRIV